jgi:hypothetical protein
MFLYTLYPLHTPISMFLSQLPRGLRHELSSPTQTLGLWVPAPLEAWLCGCVYSVFMLYCL